MSTTDARYAPFVERYPALSLIGNTRFLPVNAFSTELPGWQIFAKTEWTNPGGSLKDRPVQRMVLEAVLGGEVRAGSLGDPKARVILDSSSGNAGIAYAMIGAMMRIPVHLVVPGNASAERKKRILAHGAKLTLTDPLEGYDEALRTCHKMGHDDEEHFFLSNQYANANNWKAHYYGTAAEIIEQAKARGVRITHFVSGIGTGGTITGCGRRLKEHDPKIKVVCIIPDNFPGIEGLKPLENPEDIRPEILDESVIDERIKVTIDDAFDYCALLAKNGVFVGQSSGAYLYAVHQLGKREKSGVCATIFNDIGERYFSTRLWDVEA